jgi:hypothetical protein
LEKSIGTGTVVASQNRQLLSHPRQKSQPQYNKNYKIILRLLKDRIDINAIENLIFKNIGCGADLLWIFEEKTLPVMANFFWA